jgi:hypothetical protein
MLTTSYLKEFLINSNEKIKQENEFVLCKIGIWLKKNELSNNSKQIKQQNKKELIDLGAFICCYNPDIEVIDGLRESPDFIVSYKNKKIGVELRDLCNQDEMRNENVLKMLFKNVEDEIKTKTPSLLGSFNISLKVNNINKMDYIPFKNELLKLITNESVENKYINAIRESKSSKLHIYSGQGYCVGGLTKEMVIKVIKEKEEKLNKYLSENYFDEIWLLNVIGGLGKSSDYSYFDNSLLDSEIHTSFYKIFLFDFFRKQVIEVKCIKSNAKPHS